MSTSDAPLMPVALRHGLTGGLIAIVWALLKNMTGYGTNTMAGLVDLLIYGYTAYAAINALRTEQEGFITLGKSIGVGTLACAIVGVLAGIFVYIYYNFIDPSAVEELIQASIEIWEQFGMTEDQMEEAAEGLQNGFTLPRSLLSGVGVATVIGFISSLIGGAIMKNEAPNV